MYKSEAYDHRSYDETRLLEGRSSAHLPVEGVDGAPEHSVSTPPLISKSAMTTQTIQQSPMQLFQKQWKNYQIVLEGDFLEHKDLYEAVKQWLVRAARDKGPLRLADIGCGDSEYISRLIAEAGGPALVSSYTGVDLCGPALELSKCNVAR